MTDNIKIDNWVNLVRDDGIIFDTFKYDKTYICKKGFSLEVLKPKQQDNNSIPFLGEMPPFTNKGR